MFFGGVGNVRIWGVVNVLLANDSQSVIFCCKVFLYSVLLLYNFVIWCIGAVWSFVELCYCTTDCCFEDEHEQCSFQLSYVLYCVVRHCFAFCDIVLCFVKLWIVLFCVVLHCAKCCATMCKVLVPPVRFSGFLPRQPRLHLPSR